MKRYILYRWAFAAIMALASITTVSADNLLITSLDQLSAGDVIKIYPHGNSGVASMALACSGEGNALTSYSEAGDGDEWTLEDAGDECYYLRNNLGYYWAYQAVSASGSLTCTTDENSAVKIKLTWDNKNNGVCFWNQKDKTGLNNLNGRNNMYNWWSSPNSYNFDTNTTFTVYEIGVLVDIEVDGIKYNLNTMKGTAKVCEISNISGDIKIPEYIDFDAEHFIVTSFSRKNFFQGCSNLKSITLPNSITSLGNSCFQGCSNLESITLPNSITSLGNSCFQGCSSLKNITLPNSVTSLGYSCFQGCSNLDNITLPNSVTSLGYSCFQGCSSLKNITLPNSVTSLGYSCFQGCSNLDNITLPNSITYLGTACFYHCSSLKNITLPNSIKFLRYNCFYDCSSLESIILPNSIKTLDGDCFTDCSSLKNITLPNSITFVGNNCFIWMQQFR